MNPELALLFVAGVYFLPAVTAVCRGVEDWFGLTCLNLVFGWTGLGWFLCLMMAHGPTRKEEAYRRRVNRARDEFYLREAEKSPGVSK